jgi:hypothetical protein
MLLLYRAIFPSKSKCDGRNRWMDAWIDGSMDGKIDGLIVGWTDG